jgi:hypothetical protein
MKKQFTRQHQDVKVIIDWRPLDIDNPPSVAGVYAIASPNMSNWYYIGRSINIAKRITVKSHPVQVTKDVNLGQKYFYARLPKDDIGWLERYLLKRLEPEWNGGTSFDASWRTPWVCCDVPLDCSNLPPDDVWGIADDPLRLAVLAAIEA